MTENTKTILAIGGGLAAGLLIGLLMAPDKGSETRRKIVEAAKKKAGEWKEDLLAGLRTHSEVAAK